MNRLDELIELQIELELSKLLIASYNTHEENKEYIAEMSGYAHTELLEKLNKIRERYNKNKTSKEVI